MSRQPHLSPKFMDADAMSRVCARANADTIIDLVRNGGVLWLPHRSANACIHFNEYGVAMPVHWGEAKCASRALPFAECDDPHGDLFVAGA